MLKSSVQYHVAVVGATGNIGREILNILVERNFPANKVTVLASSKSKGQQLPFGKNKTLIVEDLNEFNFKGVDIVLASAGALVSKNIANRIVNCGAVYIDNSSCFRMDPQVPLVVPEVNPDTGKNWRQKGIIANPNCSTIQLVVALKAINDLYGIKSLRIATYQSVSGAGKEAMDELFEQTRAQYTAKEVKPVVFDKEISFNVLPKIDIAMKGGNYKEEWKLRAETQKILGISANIDVMCVRVPVFIGHSEAVFVTCNKPINIDRIRNSWKNSTGITCLDDHEKGIYATAKETAGSDDVYVSRLVAGDNDKYSLQFWCVTDNLRKGGALNTVQIAELLHEKDWLTKATKQGTHTSIV